MLTINTRFRVDAYYDIVGGIWLGGYDDATLCFHFA